MGYDTEVDLSRTTCAGMMNPLPGCTRLVTVPPDREVSAPTPSPSSPGLAAG